MGQGRSQYLWNSRTAQMKKSRMLRKFSFLLTAAWLLSTLSVKAQQEVPFVCGANELHRMGSLVEGHPDRLQQIDQAQQDLEQFTRDWAQHPSRDENTYIIPVVFHIIHVNGPENISDEQVRDAVRVMNEDFNKLTPDWDQVQPEFLDRVADMEVTFKLAQLDPNGNCTNGITRTVSTLTNAGDQNMKNLIQWPRNRYLNIWVAASAQGAAGYSMYPSSVTGQWGEAADGIVVLHSYVGAIGTSSIERSHTLSHEAGHWLNLKHCWGDSNDPGLPSNCDMDDNVSDTPNTKGWTSCNLRGASCGSTVDNVENFMEYSYCSKMFTNGQKTRVHAALNSNVASRSNLWSPANLALTGVNAEPQICEVEFTSNMRTICAGQSINFTDASYNGVTEWSWSFAGGTPAAASTATTTVTYAEPGTYSVSLTVGDGSESMTETEEQYITVLPSDGAQLPLSESFEGSGGLASTIWTPQADIGAGFQVSSSAGYTGPHSLMVPNNNSNSGRAFNLISNTVNVAASSPAVISFRYAFAKRNDSNNDALYVYISRDCGQTWSMRRALGGDNLKTAPNTGSSFVPSGPDQWGYSETPPISGTYAVSDLRVKFVFQSGGGNNLWIDDINIDGAVGIAEQGTVQGSTLSVVPNPAKDVVEIGAFLATAGSVKADLVDLLGRPVREIAAGMQPVGEVRWTVDLAGLPAGLYFIRVQQAGRVQVGKLTKE